MTHVDISRLIYSYAADIGWHSAECSTITNRHMYICNVLIATSKTKYVYDILLCTHGITDDKYISITQNETTMYYPSLLWVVLQYPYYISELMYFLSLREESWRIFSISYTNANPLGGIQIPYVHKIVCTKNTSRHERRNFMSFCVRIRVLLLRMLMLLPLRGLRRENKKIVEIFSTYLQTYITHCWPRVGNVRTNK